MIAAELSIVAAADAATPNIGVPVVITVRVAVAAACTLTAVAGPVEVAALIVCGGSAASCAVATAVVDGWRDSVWIKIQGAASRVHVSLE